MEFLQKLINLHQINSPLIGIVLVAHAGNSITTITISQKLNNTLDSGASDHMTCDFRVSELITLATIIFILKSNCIQEQFSNFTSYTKDESAIILWYYKLGRPNFSYLQGLVPSLFINKDFKNFQCEIINLLSILIILSGSSL